MSVVYKVEKGDTIERIAARFSVSASLIKERNRVSEIRQGMRLLIEQTAEKPANAVSGAPYVVKPLETLESIAARFNIAPERLAAHNSVSRVFLGQTIRIPPK